MTAALNTTDLPPEVVWDAAWKINAATLTDVIAGPKGLWVATFESDRELHGYAQKIIHMENGTRGLFIKADGSIPRECEVDL